MPKIRPMPGKRPTQSTPRVQVTLSLPPDLLHRIDARADREERSRSKVVELVMRKHLESAAA